MPDCLYVKANGERCEAAALRERTYCFFHQRDRERQRNLRQAVEARRIAAADMPASAGIVTIPGTGPKGRPRTFDEISTTLFDCASMPLLENSEAVAIALTEVFRALASGQLDCDRARSMLWALQIASQVAKNTKFYPSRCNATADPEPLPNTGLYQELRAYTEAEKRALFTEEGQAEHNASKDLKNSGATAPTPSSPDCNHL